MLRGSKQLGCEAGEGTAVELCVGEIMIEDLT